MITVWLIGRITSNTVILDTETAGARCTEGQSQGIKHRHFSHKEQQKLQQRETDIDSIENLGRGLYRGNKTLHRGSRTLRPHEVHVIASGHRKDRQHKDQHAHSADPVSEAPPEQHTFRQSLHIGKNTGTGRRKAGNRLKKRIHRMRDGAGDHEGQRPHHT